MEGCQKCNCAKNVQVQCTWSAIFQLKDNENWSFFPRSDVLYFVDVTTGTESKSGTPSRVFVKLIGDAGEYGEVELGDKFEQGRFVP